MSDYMESCMDFSPLFESGNSFKLEKSDFHEKVCGGVKTVEFVTLQKKNKIYFIEAKRTAPDPNNPDSKEQRAIYYQDLYEKIHMSIDMIVSKEVGVNPDNDKEFPECLNHITFANLKLVFLLVIRNSEKKWCDEVKVTLNKKLLALRRIWKLDVIVLSGDDAISNKFVSGFVCKSDDSAWGGYQDCPRTACVRNFPANEGGLK